MENLLGELTLELSSEGMRANKLDEGAGEPPRDGKQIVPKYLDRMSGY